MEPFEVIKNELRNYPDGVEYGVLYEKEAILLVRSWLPKFKEQAKANGDLLISLTYDPILGVSHVWTWVGD